MATKKMLGEKIYTLRNKKRLSQEELGKMVGVSNKAVSKWETDEANPEISLLPKLAKVFEITTDELLDAQTDEKQITVVKTTDKEKQSKFCGLRGTVVKEDRRYEFVSNKKNKKGLPFLHVNIGGKADDGTTPKACGTIAIGNIACGKIAIGLKSRGVLSIGLLSFGLFSIGLLSLGLFAIGLLSVGLFAFGFCFAIGGIAVGGIALGIIAFGGIAIGVIAGGAIVIGYFVIAGDNSIVIGEIIKRIKE